MKLECRPDGVNVAGMRMTVVLSHVIEVECEMLVDLPAYPKVDAVTNPRGRNRIVKNFVGHEPGELSLAEAYWMINLQTIPVLCEVWSGVMEVKFDAVTIANGETSGRKSHRRF